MKILETDKEFAKKLENVSEADIRVSFSVVCKSHKILDIHALLIFKNFSLGIIIRNYVLQPFFDHISRILLHTSKFILVIYYCIEPEGMVQSLYTKISN